MLQNCDDILPTLWYLRKDLPETIDKSTSYSVRGLTTLCYCPGTWYDHTYIFLWVAHEAELQASELTTFWHFVKWYACGLNGGTRYMCFSYIKKQKRTNDQSKQACNTNRPLLPRKVPESGCFGHGYRKYKPLSWATIPKRLKRPTYALRIWWMRSCYAV